MLLLAVGATRQLAFLLPSTLKFTFQTVSPLHNYKEYIHGNKTLGNFWPRRNWLQTDWVWEGDNVRFSHSRCPLLKRLLLKQTKRDGDKIEILWLSSLKLITLEQSHSFVLFSYYPDVLWRNTHIFQEHFSMESCVRTCFYLYIVPPWSRPLTLGLRVPCFSSGAGSHLKTKGKAVSHLHWSFFIRDVISIDSFDAEPISSWLNETIQEKFWFQMPSFTTIAWKDGIHVRVGVFLVYFVSLWSKHSQF